MLIVYILYTVYVSKVWVKVVLLSISTEPRSSRFALGIPRPDEFVPAGSQVDSGDYIEPEFLGPWLTWLT